MLLKGGNFHGNHTHHAAAYRQGPVSYTHLDVYKRQALELAPEGTGYRARTRFSKFFNLPELMNLFREVADIKTADQLHLPTPEVEYHNIVAQPTEQQQEMVKALSERASLSLIHILPPPGCGRSTAMISRPCL